MIRFEHLEYLNALYILPVLVIVFWLAMRWRRKALQRFGEKDLLNHLIPDISRYKHQIKFTFLLLAVAFLIVGLANPQIGTKMEEVKREGVDIIIALDVSKSMIAEDIKPNRLENAKRAISKLIDKLHNDRIGLIVFAGEAYVQLPLTADYNAAKLFLNTVYTSIVPVPGTAIGSAIDLAVKSFDENQDKHKALIIITDGENHEDDAAGSAKIALNKGVKIHTIGMGSPEGVPIPIYRNRKQRGFHKDKDGNPILTKLNERMLQEIASAADGQYIRATNKQEELSIILDEIAGMEKKEFEARIFTDYEDRFQYFLGIALLLLIAETFISARKSMWLEKLGL